MKEGEFQNCRPTHQSVGCEEALWGSGAVQPNFNYLREKRHGWRFIREHNILESRMLLQLSQINNWPCHTESVPHTVYIGTKAHRFCWKYCCSLLLWSVIYLCIPVVHLLWSHCQRQQNTKSQPILYVAVSDEQKVQLIVCVLAF